MKKRLLFTIGFAYIFAINTANASNVNMKYDFSFDQRARYENNRDFDFNENTKDNGGIFYLRTRLGLKGTLTDSTDQEILSLFVEGLDAKSWGYHVKAPTNQQDILDYQQGYVSLKNIFDSDTSIKLGRQAIKYGESRLISAPTWSNKVRVFDAAVFNYKKENFWADIIYGQVVNFNNNNFNRSSEDEKLFGIYSNMKIPAWKSSIDGYFLTLKDWRTATHKTRYTTGFHLFGELFAGIMYDLEVPFQFGEEGNQDIKAYAVHIDVSKQWKDVYLKPKCWIGYNQASGDEDSTDDENNSFLPFYGSVHAPFGLMDFFRWQNMKEIEVGAELSINEKLKIIPQMNFFWIDNENDYWYKSTGAKVRSTLPTNDVDTFVGQEISLRAKYKINKQWNLEAGYAHFFSGDYVKDTGSDDDADWAYTQVTFKF